VTANLAVGQTDAKEFRLVITCQFRESVQLMVPAKLGKVGTCDRIFGEIGISKKKVLHSLIKVAAQFGQVYRTRRVYKNSSVEGLKNWDY
jgi:hypothetical protein